jgi:hypothetical protein
MHGTTRPLSNERKIAMKLVWIMHHTARSCTFAGAPAPPPVPTGPTCCGSGEEEALSETSPGALLAPLFHFRRWVTRGELVGIFDVRMLDEVPRLDSAGTCGLPPFPSSWPRENSLAQDSLSLGSFQVETVKVHDLDPCVYEVTHEPLARVVGRVDFRGCPQLGA